jgi:hypothetical protein
MEAGWLTDLTVLQGITFEQAQGESFALFYFPSGIQPFMAYLCRQILSRGAKEKNSQLPFRVLFITGKRSLVSHLMSYLQVLI